MSENSDEKQLASAVGARIREVRLAAGMTQQDLAIRIGAGHALVSKWERGEHLPQTASVIAIARECESSSTYLLEGRHESPVALEALIAAGAVDPDTADDEAMRALLRMRKRLADDSALLDVVCRYYRVPGDSDD